MSVATVLGAAVDQAARPVNNAANALQKQDAAGMQSLKTAFLPAVGVGAVGALLWKKHRVLGALAGAAVGGNAYDLVKGNRKQKIDAGCTLGAELAAVGASLYWKKHRAWGYVLGLLGGNVAGVLVKGKVK